MTVKISGRIQKEFSDWIVGDKFSCLAGKASLRRGALAVVELGQLGGADSTRSLHQGLADFVSGRFFGGRDFQSYVAVFAGPSDTSELEFERMLWRQLSDLALIDNESFGWAEDVSAEPRSPDFAFSLAGHPLFVVGMHANASRISRRFPLPALAFNSHHQFRRLKESGNFSGLQGKIRDRDIRLQGSINPNLAEFGEVSEARQYSGRVAGRDWTCPISTFDTRRAVAAEAGTTP
ncbi:guanitoxin biosynthesis heme-dependent pre-guanitoxin N-hydroxylase GntA [Kitasatospora purpeofusca]|uniref:guanitoxin biosynthesis heme-dependent pre-guanitoxin N-hydroxylase GntA n=1 Tax=Kitasatospora purpeofusca TaxID=67352 RepID=UPI0030F1BF48